jgi:hypothetical protein
VVHSAHLVNVPVPTSAGMCPKGYIAGDSNGPIESGKIYNAGPTHCYPIKGAVQTAHLDSR